MSSPRSPTSIPQRVGLWRPVRTLSLMSPSTRTRQTDHVRRVRRWHSADYRRTDRRGSDGPGPGRTAPLDDQLQSTPLPRVASRCERRPCYGETRASDARRPQLRQSPPTRRFHQGLRRPRLPIRASRLRRGQRLRTWFCSTRSSPVTPRPTCGSGGPSSPATAKPRTTTSTTPD